MPLVVVLVVADGMIEGITARYIEVGTYHLQAQSLYVVTGEELKAKVEALKGKAGIKAVFPESDSYGVALFGGRSSGVELRAVDPSFLADSGTAAYLRLGSGEMKLDSTNQILLGEALARNLGAKVGDIVSLVTSRPVAFGESYSSFTPKVSAFRVKGIVSAGYRQLDELWAFVSFRAGEKLFTAGSSHQIIGIKVGDPYGKSRACQGRSIHGPILRLERLHLARGRAQRLQVLLDDASAPPSRHGPGRGGRGYQCKLGPSSCSSSSAAGT